MIAENGLTTTEQVTNFTKAGGACGGCLPEIQKLIDEVLEKGKVEQKKPKLSNLKKMQMVQEVLERDIRPMLRADGGDLELIDIDGDLVQIAFRKACAGCASSGNTARFVEMKLRELVYEGLQVQEVQA